MNILGFRRGFAANSSSDHSIILVPPGKVKDSLSGLDGDYEYGWSNFTLASASSKHDYIAVQLFHDLLPRYGKEITSDITQSIMGAMSAEEIGGICEGYVDHQSRWGFPREPIGDRPNRQFIREMIDFLLKDTTVILGGNDNEDRHPLRDDYPNVDAPFKEEDSFVCRKDTEFNYWTLFNKYNGNRIRMSWDTAFIDPKGAMAPELVDLKITQRCDKGCPHCYQDSTKEGKHADRDQVCWILENLSRLGVFEIAMGGGEPTEHPEFPYFVDTAVRYGIVPNVTTGKLKSLATIPLESLAKLGKIAVTVSYYSDVQEIMRYIGNRKELAGKMSLQYVMGVMYPYDIERLFIQASLAQLPITLLGFKRAGRGSSFKREKYPDWVGAITKLKPQYLCPSIGIDTCLAAESGVGLRALGINPILYGTDEGRYSLYIDAVEATVDLSSYKETNKQKLPKSSLEWENFLRAYWKHNRLVG